MRRGFGGFIMMHMKWRQAGCRFKQHFKKNDAQFLVQNCHRHIDT